MFRTRWINKLLTRSRSQGQRRRPTAPTQRLVRLRLEPLEDRIVPAADPTTVLAGNAAVNFYGSNSSPSFNVPVAVNDNLGGTATSGTVSIYLVYNGSTPPPPVLLGSATVGSNGTALVGVSSGSLPANLQTGSYQLEETYGGNATFAASDAFGSLSVNADATTVVVGNASVNFGNSSPFNITVGVNSPNGTVNSGTVGINLVANNTTTFLGTATVSGGTATLNVTNPGALSVIAGLAPGSYQLSETFSDTANGQFAGSTGTGSLTVNAAPTTVVSGNATVNFGNSLPFTITVGVNSANSTVGGGTVTVDLVHDNTTTTLGTGTVGANGTANVSVTGAIPLAVISGLASGNYQLVETYSGNSPFAGSSATGTLTVSALPTTISLGNVNLVVGTSSPFSITVGVNTPNGPATSGTVTLDLVSGNTTIPLGTATVGPNGTATITVTGVPLATLASLPTGSYQLLVNFTGTAGGPFGNSTTVGNLTITPTPIPVTSVIPGNAVSTANGGPTTIPVVVNSPAGTVYEGTVTITLVTPTSTSVIGTGTVSGGSANVSANIPAGLTPGNYSLVETYTDANGNFLGSSATGVLTVNPMPAILAALEFAIDLAEIPLLLMGNTGALRELEMFSQAILHQPIPMSVPDATQDAQTLFPQTGGMGIPALGTALWLAQDLQVENPMS
jgi:hypothetical protein